ncbi:hypothetical protein [Streptomyces sp. V4I2]|uniref:hypothetical protein n=1 Tax=Streptomyces sp. V4I2 TaxID=3042280 RepID=UPI002780B825|nr:hypothetical protein [Streptomyces sp. V4I2]MDQ1045597.1 hypothetical protein [Streptomyces sp. V4I2]
MIQPDQIPQYTGDLAQLEIDHADLKKDAGHVRTTGGDVHSQFQGLSAYYTAPEAEQLFATTKPVKERADTFADDLETVSSALSSYATEIRPLVDKLKQLKTDATTFVSSVKDDDEWEYDGDKVEEHNQIRDDITATVAAFWAAERTAHNKITALWGGTQMVAGDGSERKDQYGFSADDMKNAKLPWGDPVEEKHHWYEVGHWVKSFVWDGLIVDGIWGTIKGLGMLVGFGGWDAMGQAWKGLAQLATGLTLSMMPGAQVLFWALPDDKLPSWIRDSRTAMKETGKALVAWDEWGKNPGRAAGAVTFNVVTTVFTGGAGAGVAGAGKAGAVAKVLSAAGKAGRVLDPMTYIAKGAGAGLSKIGDISAALKGVGNIDIPALPENAFTLPEGAVKLPDGTVNLPEGATIPDGATRLPDGNIKLPDDTPVLPAGTTKLPSVDGSPAQYMDPNGNLLDNQGNMVDNVDNAPTDVVDRPTSGNPADGAGGPRVDSAVKEPALVGAGARTAEQPVHLGSSVGHDLGDVGRTTRDDLPVQAGHDIPTAQAGHDLSVGGAGEKLPGGPADDLGTGHTAGPEAPGGSPETTGTSAGAHQHTTQAGHGSSHDTPSGGNADDGASGGGHADADDASTAHSQDGRGEGAGVGGNDDGTPPPHDSNPGPEEKKPGLIRQDDNFTSEHNAKGQRKSHLNADGDLVPANPDGRASVVDHIVGRDPAKSDSPFTSLSSEGANAKAFGSNRIRVDLDRLERDIAAGRVSDVEVYPPERVQGHIQETADKIAGRPVDLTVPPGTTKSQAEELARSMGLSNTKAKRIAQRMIDMMNTRRDQEWLIKGVVPREYIEGPFGG